MTHEFWDERYVGEHYAYGTEPNAFLVSQQNQLDACMRALAVGDGEGRNGVWLAQQGLDVHSVDFSAAGLRKAENLAHQRGVKLRTECIDLVTWEWPSEAYELIVSVFVHFPSATRLKVHSGIWRALIPGGLLIMEAFHPDQLKYQTGGPPDLDMLYTAEMLHGDFPDAEFLHLEELVTNLDEGNYHLGYASVVRAVLQK